MSNGLSAAVRRNLIALQQIASEIGRVQTRLATGKRVNTATDDPAAFFTASSLNARAAALNSVIDQIGLGKQALEAASNGIDSIQSLISNARGLAYQALSSPSTLADVTGNVTGLTGASAITMANGNTITVSDGTTTATYTHAGGNDVQDLIDSINTTPGLKAHASLTTDGRIQIEATGVNNVTIGGTASGAELSAVGLSAGTTTSTTNAQRQALAQQFDSIRSQIGSLAADSGFNGQNLLGGGTLSITLNETGSASVVVSGSTVTASSLGIGAASGSGGNFQYDGDINTFIAQLDAASASLKTMAASYDSNLGVVSVREEFAKAMSNTLQTGADNLTLADTNEEGAMLLALQARQKLAATSLSLAAEADKTTLRLFGVN
jgi:flagellin-like hook-associated protein FlgL